MNHTITADQVHSASPVPESALTVEVFDNMAAAEPAWRSLEATGTLTPYQRYDWIAGLHAAGASCTARLAICVVRRGDQPVALLPLLLYRERILTRARMLGTEQSNSDWMVLGPGFSPNTAELMDIFGQVSKAVGGIDLLDIQKQPRNWWGVDNPLLQLPHSPAASNLYTVEIGGAAQPYIESRVPAKKRGNLKRGRRRLEESIGAVRLVRVADETTLLKVHAEFLEQRRARFSEMGIGNVFGSPMFKRFFRDMAIQSFGAERPTMVAHALMAGDEIVATTWGTMSGNHYSLYINSTTSGSASRYSLMGITIADLMDDLLASGITSFDLGLGDFDYKTEWTQPQAVYDSFIPLTSLGRVAATLTRQRKAIKRRIKQDPRLWQLAGRARRMLFRLRGGDAKP